VLAPRLGRVALQAGAVVIAVGVLWCYEVISSHGLQTGSLDLAAPQLVTGLGIGMLVSPLFDFILASVTDDEAGSASGVLNSLQQLAGAIGVAVIGTVFFTTLSHHGFVSAIERCLIIEMATAPVLLALTWLLPARAREHEPVDAPSPGRGLVLDEPATPQSVA
jgi:hypothetical protein